MTEGNKYGLQKVTLADFPGEVAATIFTTGCNLRCPYCHNAELAAGIIPAAFLSLEKILEYLKKRQHLLGGVCITGGEPLMDKNITYIIEKIQNLGLKIKLDTNGLFPAKLKKVKVDFIAMDIKTTLSRYDELGYKKKDAKIKLKESIQYIINSKTPHEFRTTAMPGLVNKEDIIQICNEIKGANQYTIAAFNPENTLDPTATQIKPWNLDEMKNLASIAKEKGLKVSLRGI